MVLTKITRYSKCIVVDTYIADVPSSADLREVGDCPMADPDLSGVYQIDHGIHEYLETVDADIVQLDSNLEPIEATRKIINY
jgi:hypothetical protein